MTDVASALDRLAARIPQHVLALALCLGLVAALAVRAPASLAWALLAVLGAAAAVGDSPGVRLAGLALAVAALGWWWGGVRLHALDQSVLAAHVGEHAPAVVVVTGPVRHGRYSLRMPAEVRRFGSSLQSLDEPVLLQLALPSNRAPPEQGAIVDLDTAEVREPRAPEEAHGFDERGWLRRQGVHVVLRARAWTSVGHRGGIGGAADALRIWIRRPLARALSGERLAVVAGVVLGADEGLSDELKSEFRASGLYHLLAVSGQNVVFIVVGVLLITWLLALPRWLGHVAAIATIGAYVLAVGLQPSVVRAAVAGVLGSLAWLAARPTDRWYFLLLGAAALLAWNPYSLLDPGFQLSFAAVVAIFVAVPWIERRLEGYPLPRKLATVLAVSTACGVATAPIVLLEFGQVPIYSVVANAFAEPVVGPLLGLALISAVLDPLVPSAATALASLDGWLAAYLAACARLVARLPYAQVSSVRALGLLAALAALVAVSRLPPHIPLAVGRRNR